MTVPDYPALVNQLSTIISLIKQIDVALETKTTTIAACTITLKTQQIEELQTKRNEYKTRKDEICDQIKQL